MRSFSQSIPRAGGIKRCFSTLLVDRTISFLAVLAGITALTVHGAINVGSLQTFTTFPPASDWSTKSVDGSGAAITTALAMDAAVQTNTAGSISAALVPSVNLVPGNNALARYTTNGGFVGTHPTGNSYTILMATVVNTTPGFILAPVISYDFGLPAPLAGEDAELAGHRVYYSQTGQANSWTRIPELTSPATPVPASLIVTLHITWGPGNPLYIIWVDDNGGPGTDGMFSIDNFLVSTGITPPRITRQPVGTNVVEGQTIELSVQATGPGITYTWQKEVGAIDPANPTLNQPTLVITNASLAEAGTYFCVVANAAGSPSSSHVVVNVSRDSTPPAILSAIGNALDSTLVDLKVSEPLCLDSALCGSSASAAFIWHVREKANFFAELGVVEPVNVSGTNVTLQTGTPRTPGVAYIVTVDAQTLADPFGNSNPSEISIDLTPAIGFRQGLNGYSGTHDTELRGAAPDTVQVNNTFVTVDLDDPGGSGLISHGLLRFEGVFGNNADQIPLGSQIISATLTLVHSAANAGGDPVEMHRLLIPFDEATATYNNFGATPGLQADGTEASTAVDERIISGGTLAVPFTLTIDVTTTVQAWANGEPNYGWGFIPTGTDGYRWDTSESANPPALSVVYKIVECNTAPSITQDPVGVTPNEGANFTLGAAISACNPGFQWIKDDVDIPGANQATYTTVALAGPSGSSGTYRLRVTNPNGTVTSGPATVSVAEDSTHPKLISAAGSLNGTTVTLSFSKALKTVTAETTANYSLTPSVPITSAVLDPNRTQVTLTSAPRTAGAYTLRISGLTDDRFLANVIDPNPTLASVTSPGLSFGYGVTWKYETNSQDATLSSGTPWYAPGFNDAAWFNGSAFFGFETGQAVTNSLPPPRIVTTLPPNSDTNFPNAAVTSYFRRSINLPVLPAGGVYALCHYIDDGAVFYLDGLEFARYNMPANAGPLLFTNRASAAIEASLQCVLFTASPGAHSLAIEVHQGGVTTSDVVFGAEIVALPAPPRLTAAPDPAGVRVSWNGDAAWELFSSRPVTGAYGAVAGNPVGAFLVPTAAATNTEFFILRYRDPQ